MKLYTDGKGNWAGSLKGARKVKKEHGTKCKLQEVPKAKQELLDFLNKHRVVTERTVFSPMPTVVGPIKSDKSTCPSLKEVRKERPEMTEGGYISYKYGWDKVGK